MSDRIRIFRWRAVGPLLLFLVLLVTLWVLFADEFARTQAESNLSEILGTEVDLAKVRIRTADAAVDLSGLAIADPRNPARNLFEAAAITFDLDPVPLTEKKIVIDELKLSGLRFLTIRKTPARPSAPDSPAGQLLRETTEWAKDKFQFPKLALGRIDSLKNLVLNPDQLGSVKAARAFGARVDSAKGAFEQSVNQLQLKPLLDSSTALAARLAKTDPKTLGIAGARDAITSVQAAVDRLKQAKAGLATLEQGVKGSLGSLRQGLAEVDAARQRDYSFAKGQLNLPSFDAPNIGASLFGQQSTDYFQQALYAARIVQRYVPPGLQPWNRPGPKRTRLAGTTVEFPKLQEYPRFLLKKGMIDLAAGRGEANQLKAEFDGITSQPALYGRPATITAHGRIGAESPISVDLAALSRHFGKAPTDSLVARVGGVALPTIPLPGLPFAVHPGKSAVGLAFSLSGDSLSGAWDVSSDQASWSSDSAGPNRTSLVESTVWQVVSGLTQLKVHAELGGTVQSPTIKVSSNLDDAIATRLRALAGEQLAKGEQKAREAVDALVNQQITAVNGQLAGLTTQITDRLPVERGQLDSAQKALETQLKRLAGSAAGGLHLPKL
jgi:uncharacterized protein (TIGR03545 family)